MRPLAFVLGIYVCFVATITHRHATEWMGIRVPWGLILAVAGTFAIAVAAERLTRGGTIWFMLGWATGLVWPMLVPGTSYFVAQDAIGLLFMFGAVGSLAVAAVHASRLSQ